jgi:hypothetical protein
MLENYIKHDILEIQAIRPYVTGRSSDQTTTHLGQLSDLDFTIAAEVKKLHASPSSVD